jgi:hypothetical protein
MPMLRSTVAIRLFAPALSSLLETIFSRASTMPSLHRMPMAVPPFSTALTAYSTCRGQPSAVRVSEGSRTWKLRPSGEKTELFRS